MRSVPLHSLAGKEHVSYEPFRCLPRRTLVLNTRIPIPPRRRFPRDHNARSSSLAHFGATVIDVNSRSWFHTTPRNES